MIKSLSFPQKASLKPKNQESVLQRGDLEKKDSSRDTLSFIVPCLMFVQVKAVGTIYGSELLCIFLLPFVLFFSNGFSKAAKKFLFLGIVWLASQIATDIWRLTPFVDYSRGWSKIVFFLVNFLVIYIIIGHNRRRLYIFAIGWTISNVLLFYISPTAAARELPWKFGFGYSFTLMIAFIASSSFFLGRDWMRALLMWVICSVNMILGARSLGGICFITGVYSLLNSPPHLSAKKAHSRPKLIFVPVALAISFFVLIKSYTYSAEAGLLGPDARHKYEIQASSPQGILLSARVEPIVAFEAIKDSPLLGHGSWAKDFYYTQLYYSLNAFVSRRENDSSEVGEMGLIPTHSHLLGAWVESGILGALFWFWLLIFIIKILINMNSSDIHFKPIVFFFSTLFIWDILFSPFGADRRMFNAFALVVFLYADKEIKSSLRNNK